MELHIMRHAQAVPRGILDSDADRPLTEEGVAKTRGAAAGLKALGIRFDRVVSSLLTRARQTAETVIQELNQDVEMELSDALGHGFTPDAATKLLQTSKPGESILFVGHMPDCGDLAAYLISGDEGGGINFRKGAVARIDLGAVPRPGTGELIWLLTQKHLRMIGKGA